MRLCVFGKKINRNISRLSERNVDDNKSVTYEELKKTLKENKDAILIDVRSKQEYKEGHIDEAISIPLYELQIKIGNVVSNKEQPIMVYCQSGVRSLKAIERLKCLGYTNVYCLKGGMDGI